VKTKVAIACQGAGSQTAFTVGALMAILKDPDFDERYELGGKALMADGQRQATAFLRDRRIREPAAGIPYIPRRYQPRTLARTGAGRSSVDQSSKRRSAPSKRRPDPKSG